MPTTDSASAGVLHLRAAGTSLVLDPTGDGLPRVLHWGDDLGDLDAAQLEAFAAASVPPRYHVDEPYFLSLMPSAAEVWAGSPAVAGARTPGPTVPPVWRLTGLTATPTGTGGRVELAAQDRSAGLELELTLELDRFGVLRMRPRLTNTGETPYLVSALRSLLPLPALATEVLDLTGTWCRERTPQRGSLRHGTHLRASRRGRTGHDATLLLVAGESGFGFRHGQVWGCHVAWSGNHEHLVERLPEGAGLDAAVLGGGEVLAPGEVVLGPSESYAAPEAYFVHAADGLDGLSRRLHRQLRARPGHPASPRPVVLNTWEAVYFDHDLARLTALADVAASIGVERFVLDDGWFRHRRDDTAGLGDWFVDEDVWPQGLHPLVDHVRGLGLQMGLWFEPEMVNPDSDLARAHPDWILTPSAPLQRQQQGLDVANPDAFAYLLDRLDRLVGEYRLDYLKWDHNRDLPMAVHDGRPGIHDQTLATYRLLEELRARHPGLEIESCSSGGARVDLGILQRTDRVWASDTNDPFERQLIQFWTGLLLPPELVGTHIGPPVAHTTSRYAPLAFRAATALFGHAGIEWDVTECTPEQLDALSAWIRLYKELSGLLHDGDVVRADLTDDGTLVHGVVAEDGSQAVFAYVRLETRGDTYPPRLRLPGLDPARSYRVRPRYEAGAPAFAGKGLPSWLPAPEQAGVGPGSAVTADAGVLLPGALLERVGLPAPVMYPGSALLLHLVAE